MRFRRPLTDPPEINLIPFIDVLLVILIFLMLSTTYSKFTELQITLPSADSEKLKDRPLEIVVGVSVDGRYVVNHQPLDGRTVEALQGALRTVANGHTDATLIISADAAAAHQSVINVMDAARREGLSRVTFAAQADSR